MIALTIKIFRDCSLFLANIANKSEALIPVLPAAYFSFLEAITKPLYIFYARNLADTLEMYNPAESMANTNNRQLSLGNKTRQRR